MEFKSWINEVADLRRPSGSIRKRKIVVDKGTSIAHEAIQFQFKTQLGNVVKVRFVPSYIENSYTVSFYVNDKLDDDAKLNNSVRDPEILPGAFYLIKNRADKLGATELNFTARRSFNDTKNIKSLDVEKFKQPVMDALKNLYQTVNSQPINMVPSDPKLNQLLGITGNHKVPDFEKDTWLRCIHTLVAAIKTNDIPEINPAIYNLLYQFDKEPGLARRRNRQPINFGIEPLQLKKLLMDLEGAIQSNTENGWDKKLNRRANIYEKLLQRYFSQDWNYKRDNTTSLYTASDDRFILTRKTNDAQP